MSVKECVPNEVQIDIGWDLKVKKKMTAFTAAQKDFMIDYFNIGNFGGYKVSQYTEAEEVSSSGQYTNEEFPKAQYIGSFFSRHAQQQKRNTDDLYVAEEGSKMSIKRPSDIVSYLETAKDKQ